MVLKRPEDWTLIGTRAARIDLPAKVDGSARFGLDVRLPGQLTALVAHPPVFERDGVDPAGILGTVVPHPTRWP